MPHLSIIATGLMRDPSISAAAGTNIRDSNQPLDGFYNRDDDADSAGDQRKDANKATSNVRRQSKGHSDNAADDRNDCQNESKKRAGREARDGRDYGNDGWDAEAGLRSAG